MSSPLSTLRKISRVPLPETEGESKRYKDRPVTVSVPSDTELMSSMIQKLTQLEKKVKIQTVEIDKKTRQITDLEEKLKLLQEGAGRQREDNDGLIRRCQKLQKQIWEMERFLNDYGMMWAGNADEDEDPEDDADNEHAARKTKWRPEASLVRRFHVDFDLVLKNIRDLNLVAGEGGSRVTYVPGGAKLSRRSSVPLRLFKNGIVMFDGPFRSYSESSTQQCMQDLMDGYFPSELQDRFPDGVIFQVIDRRGEEFGAGFPGKGNTVKGSEEVMRLIHQSWSRLPDRRSSVQRFVNKLPGCVVRAGKVIPIRSALRDRLQGSDGAKSHLMTVIRTPALQTLSESLDSGKRDITSLRVKSEDGEKTFILKMFSSETVGDLRRYLDAHRGSGGSPYDIISAFPYQRRHGDDARTLLACGLTPSAALLLRSRPQ